MTVKALGSWFTHTAPECVYLPVNALLLLSFHVIQTQENATGKYTAPCDVIYESIKGRRDVHEGNESTMCLVLLIWDRGHAVAD